MERLLAWKQVQASKRFARNRRPNPVFSSLESLPMEVLQIVLDQLDSVSLVCLRNTSCRLRAVVPPMRADSLSRCQKWLIMCRFETDMQDYPELVACAFCKVKRPQTHFGLRCKTTGWAKIINFCGMELPNMMDSEPIARYCYRHLEICLVPPPAFQNDDEIKWIRTLEPTCLHCGSKPASCGQTALRFFPGPRVPHSSCDIPCDICPTAYLATFSRHGSLQFPRLTTRTRDLIGCFDATLRGKRKTVERKCKEPRLFTFMAGFLTRIVVSSGTIIEKDDVSTSDKHSDSRTAQAEGRCRGRCKMTAAGRDGSAVGGDG
ncbi:hypothetical protein MMC07_004141 [Pseudocyphellaria aurata]|nr:hypothetical protein [Pseudocyphellaria aurata]